MIITDITSQCPFPVHKSEAREGTHLSDIIGEMYRALFSKEGNADGTDPTLTYELGYLWEDTLSTIWADRIGQRLGSACVDGVWVSPDGVVIGDDGLIDEYKATKMSMPDTLVELPWRWRVQVMSYCYAFGYTKARVWAWYINGN
jgi:hypothetical protein